MEVLLIEFLPALLSAGVTAISVTLLARFVSVGLPAQVFDRWFSLSKRGWRVLTWGGLRGGIAVALALSLPLGPERSTVLTLTYCVVVFLILILILILIQGLTIGHVVRSSVQCRPD